MGYTIVSAKTGTHDILENFFKNSRKNLYGKFENLSSMSWVPFFVEITINASNHSTIL